MKKEDIYAAAVAVTAPDPRPMYDEIEVAPPDDSPPSSPERPVTLGDVENSMEEDDPPRLDEENSSRLPMEDVKTDAFDDDSQMQLD